MKRNTKATAILLAALIASAAAGCGSSESSNSSSYSSSTIPSSQVSSDSVSSEPQKLGLEGDLKYGYIKLNTVYFQADNRNNALVINWKNTTSVSTTFDDCFNVVLYLDGEKLPHKEIHKSYTTSDGFKVDSDTIYQEVSPGETVTVDYLFDLNLDANSDSILTMFVYANSDNSKAVYGECEVYPDSSSSSSSSSPDANSSSAPVSSTPSNYEGPSGTENAVYTATLTPGNYEVGVDIPSGIYTIDVISGESGWIHNAFGGTDRGFSFTANSHSDLRTSGDSDSSVKTFDGASLLDDDVLTVNDATVTIYNVAAKGQLNQIKNTEGESITLSSGNYTSGDDIVPGVYDVEIISGNAALRCLAASLPSGGVQLTTDEVSQSMGLSSTYKNINLAEGRTFQIIPTSGDTPLIKFTPSTYQHKNLV